MQMNPLWVKPYRAECKKKDRRNGAPRMLRNIIDSTEYFGEPARGPRGSRINATDEHRAFVLACALQVIRLEQIAHELCVTKGELLEHFGAIIANAQEIERLQYFSYVHRVAQDPTIDPKHEAALCRNFGVVRTLERSKEYPHLQLHWVVILGEGMGPEWLQRERPKMPEYYFDPPPPKGKKAA